MTPRSLAILALLGVLALAGGWYFGVAQAPQDITVDAGSLMFPDLAARLGDAARVELVHGASTIRLVKNAKGDGWGLAERGGYGVDVGKLRGLLTGLTELRLTEKRTADPGELGRLGLEDPAGKNSTATSVRVLDGAGHPLAELVVGRSRVRTEGNLPADVYVRRPDENQSWLAQGGLDVDTDPLAWLDRDIMDISPARIASASVTNGASHLVLTRSDEKLDMTTPADHPKLDDAHVDEVARVLSSLTLQDVAADKDAPTGEALGQAVFTAQDGLAVTATALKAGDALWVRFAASGKDDEAKRINARIAGWIYQIGAWKQQALVPTLDDLKAAPPPAPAPAPAKP